MGGVGEIGKNMTALEFGNDIILIDAGMSFPTEEMPGIDLVIPDITYLTTNAKKVRGILLTHGHEDHIGAVPYVLKQLNVPVFGTKLTLALVEQKLKEHRLPEDKLVCIQPRDVLQLGCFKVEFIKVSHSIAGAVALSITTPVGVVFHTGDFKVDYTPVDGETMDLARISEIGKKGVLLLLSESTNVERPGYAMSETTVGASLDELFSEHENRRIIIATFASNVHRLQQILDLAKKHRRKVAFSGRSMLNVLDVATRIGELKYDKTQLVDIDHIRNVPDKELLILSTGSQGEPMSALTRMASGNFNKVKVGKNDTILISASPIPGNEKMVYNVINNLYRLGAQVVYEKLDAIHVSGHACQEELKLMHSLLKPKFFIPVHGEYRHLKKHVDLSHKLGMREGRTMICEIGSVVQVTKTSMKQLAPVPAGAIFVDGFGFEDADSVILRDRKHLAEDGIMVVVLNVNQTSGEIVSGPEIISRGISFNNDHETFLVEAKEAILKALLETDTKFRLDRNDVKAVMRKTLRNYMKRKFMQEPMILPIVIES